jgi:cathepsin L
MDNAFLYIKKNKGIDTEESYPYEGEDDKCRYKKKATGAEDIGFVDVKSGDEDALVKAIASVGPVCDRKQISRRLYIKCSETH